MTTSEDYIDQIVRSVMREMQTRVSTVDTVAPVGKLPGRESETLLIGGRVISENVLLEAQAPGRTISIEPGAIITPSGRDYIRRNNVRVSSMIGGRSAGVSAGTLIAVGANSIGPPAASAAGWKAMAASTEFEAASLAAESLLRGMVTCCGGEPSVVACLLNRNTAVRAAVVTRSTNLATLISTMNPQVVCLDSSGWSFGEILRLLRGLAAAAAVPGDWKELTAGGVR